VLKEKQELLEVRVKLDPLELPGQKDVKENSEIWDHKVSKENSEIKDLTDIEEKRVAKAQEEN